MSKADKLGWHSTRLCGAFIHRFSKMNNGPFDARQKRGCCAGEWIFIVDKHMC
jgi:hypothetical protein